VEYPIGHRRRRKEAIPLLLKKLENNLAMRFSPERVETISALFNDVTRLENMPINQFVEVLFQ